MPHLQPGPPTTPRAIRRTSCCWTRSFPECQTRWWCSIRTDGSSPSTRRRRRIAPALRRGEPASIALRMPELVEAIRAAGLTGRAQRIEFSARLPSPRWSEAFVVPVALSGGASGRAGVVVITVHDLTPIRHVEEMRADFVANVSHELRTPLAALTGFIETLQGPAREDPAARERFLGIMQAQAWRMARLIDDLLSLSRIELRAHQRPDTPVDLIPIVRQVADGLQTLARDRDVALEIKAPAEPLMVPGDHDELTRLFENLIENGLKYGASGKRVDIALAPLDASNEALVSVRDYGPGIAAEHLPRLTERFYRVDAGESRAQGGTGLGLALVKHILNRHHGRLTIDSRWARGRPLQCAYRRSARRAFEIKFYYISIAYHVIPLSRNDHTTMTWDG